MARSHARSDDDDLATGHAAPRLSGVVRRLVRDKGYGFLAAEGQEYFFHRSALDHVDQFETLTEGQTVTFAPSQGPKGLRAEAIVVP